jgi:DNA-binding GntR family transcriptional regulator
MTKAKAKAAPLNGNQVETLDALIVAQSGFHERLIACIGAGILSSMFDKTHDAFTLIQGRYVAAMKPEQVQAFLSEGPLTKGGAKYNAHWAVAKRMREAQSALRDIEVESAVTGQDKASIAKGKAAKAAARKAGAKGDTRPFHDIQMDRVQAIYNAAKKNQVSDSPAAFDHIAAFTLLHSLADLFGQKLKEPTLPK